MVAGLTALFAVAWAVQMGFAGGVFRRLVRAPAGPAGEADEQPISVVVCVRNELASVRRLIEALYAQQHPAFEVVVVSDRSDASTYGYLLAERARRDCFRVVRVEETPAGLNPKKFALTLGIKAARHDRLVLTDADCVPASPRWLSTLQRGFAGGKSIVLSYAPYRAAPGLLNALIRYETFFAAVQYLSLGLAGKPYMGVGRNLAYTRALFLSQRGFARHAHVTGGDDDLFVGQAATARNTGVCLHPDAFTRSVPKQSFQNWYLQKRRHLSVSKHYRPQHKMMLGTLSVSHACCCVGGGLLLFTPMGWVAAFGLLARSAYIAHVLRRVARRLEEPYHWFWFPVFDLFFPFYHLFFGIPAVLAKRISWK